MAAKDEPTLAEPSRPVGAPEIPQFHLPGPGRGAYTPWVYGSATIQFMDRKRGLDETRRVAFLTPIPAVLKTLDWEQAVPTSVQPEQLVADAPAPSSYQPLPASATQVNTFKRWARAFDRWLARTQRIELSTTSEPVEPVTVGPKRGGVKVELVAIVWAPEP